MGRADPYAVPPIFVGGAKDLVETSRIVTTDRGLAYPAPTGRRDPRLPVAVLLREPARSVYRDTHAAKNTDAGA